MQELGRCWVSRRHLLRNLRAGLGTLGLTKSLNAQPFCDGGVRGGIVPNASGLGHILLALLGGWGLT